MAARELDAPVGHVGPARGHGAKSVPPAPRRAMVEGREARRASYDHPTFGRIIQGRGRLGCGTMPRASGLHSRPHCCSR